MKKRFLLLASSLFLAAASIEAQPLSWQAQPMKLGHVDVVKYSWGIEGTLGTTRAAAEFVMPIQLIYDSKEELSGMFGSQWRSPQLESRVIPQSEKVFEWQTPWGASVGLVEDEQTHRLRDSTHEWTAFSVGNGHFIISRKDGWKFTYEKGYLQEVTAPSGRKLEYRYQGKNLLSSIVQIGPQGGAEWPLLQITTDAAKGRVQSISIAGVENKFTFEKASLRLASWSRGSAPAEKLSYGAAGELASVTSPSDHQEIFTVDFGTEKAGNVIQASNVPPELPKISQSVLLSDGTFQYQYGATGGKGVTVKDHLGRKQNVNFSKQRGILTITDAMGQTSTIKYYRQLGLTYDYKVRQIKNPQGQVLTENKYNQEGDLIWSKDLLGNVTQFAVDGNGRVARVDRVLGGKGEPETVASFQWDPKGNLVRSLNALHQAVELKYNSTGDLVGLTDLDALQSEITYDERGFPTSFRDAAGNVQKLEYDSFGRLVRQISADGVSTETVFNDCGQVAEIKRILPNMPREKASTVLKNTFDADGRVIAVTDALGRTSKNEFDSEGNLVASINPAGVATRYERDGANRMVAFWMEKAGEEGKKMGRVDFERDALDRIVKQTNAIGQEITWNFDKAGHLFEKDNGVQPVHYTSNKLGETVAVDYGNGNVVNLEHDSLGRVTGISTSTSSTHYSFDKVGRVTEIRMARGKENAVLQYGYTPSGKKAFVAWTRSDGVTQKAGRTDYRYNSAGQLAEIATDGKVVAKYNYGENGMLMEKVLADGTKISYAHDLLGQISEMKVISAKGKTLTDLHYSWDAAGQLASRTWDGVEQKFSYDPAGQLIAVNSSNPENPVHPVKLPSEKYFYDLAGNMIEKTIGDEKTRMFYDEANQLLKSVSGNGALSKEMAFGYDSAGRLASEKERESVRNYQYGLFEKVSAVTKPDGSRIGFDYWPDGQMAAKGSLPPVAKIERAANESDGGIASVVEGFRRAKAEKDATENNALTVATAADKFKETESMLWDGLALLQRGEESYTVEPHVSGGVPLIASSHVEGNSSVSSQTFINDFLGTRLGTVQGDNFTPAPMTAFGESLAQGSQSRRSIGEGGFFTGKPWDSDLHAYNFLCRNYQPQLARWTATDPSGFPDGGNNLAYAPVPTSGLDPLGLASVSVSTITNTPIQNILNTYNAAGITIWTPLSITSPTFTTTQTSDGDWVGSVTGVRVVTVSANILLPLVGSTGGVHNSLVTQTFYNAVRTHEFGHVDLQRALFNTFFNKYESIASGLVTGDYDSQSAALAQIQSMESAVWNYALTQYNYWEHLQNGAAHQSSFAYETLNPKNPTQWIWSVHNPHWAHTAIQQLNSQTFNWPNPDKGGNDPE